MRLNLYEFTKNEIYKKIYHIFSIVLLLSLVPFLYTYYAIPLSSYISANTLMGIGLLPAFYQLIAFYAVMQSAHFFSMYILGTILPDINKKVITHFVENIYNIEHVQLNNNSGEITKSLFDLTESVSDIFIFFVQFLFDPILTILISFHQICTSNIKYVAYITIVWVLIITLVFYIIAKLVNYYNSRSNLYKQKVGGLLSDLLKNIFVSKVFRAKPLERDILNAIDNDCSNTQKTFTFLGYFKSVIAMFNVSIFMLLQFIVIIFAKVDTKKFLIIQSMFRGIMLSLWRLTIASTDIVKKFSTANQALCQLENINFKLQKTSNKHFLPNKKISEHEIAVKGLHFKFESNIIFKDASLQIKPKENIVIKGSSGSGKSTFLAMLFGLINSHGIFIDNIPLEDIDRNWLQQNITYISQSHMLYNTSILENITLGKQYDQNKFDDICRLCNIDSFVNNLPNGFNYQVGVNGSRLSGGQKQRICIARALLIDKPGNILICDELFNHMDQDNMDKIKNMIKSISDNRTTILVTHTNNLDDIGRIVRIENFNFIQT